MHYYALIILILFAFMIFYKEKFVSNYNMIVREAKDPILVNYMGRKKDPRGFDYFDRYLYSYIHS